MDGYAIRFGDLPGPWAVIGEAAAGAGAPLPPVHRAPLAAPLAEGGTRRDYLRARLESGRLTPMIGQESGRTLPLASANALLIRDIGAPPRNVGDIADYLVIA